jgi:hypothetical protein
MDRAQGLSVDLEDGEGCPGLAIAGAPDLGILAIRAR